MQNIETFPKFFEYWSIFLVDCFTQPFKSLTKIIGLEALNYAMTPWFIG
jgi:hypothetical protein